jgi:glucose-6-phosphate isomerase
MEEFSPKEILLDKKLYFSLGDETAGSSMVQQSVDAALQKIHALFQAEASAPFSELERGLRAWTRSHLQNEDIAQVAALARRAREEFSVLVIIGVGGSDLSARVFHDFFNHPYHNLLSLEERGGAPEVYFTGDTFDPRKLAGLLEMLRARNLLHKTLFNVISKSGTTTETMATLMVIREGIADVNWQQQVLATTGLTADSVLFRMHEQSPFYGGTLLPVPDGVGGRFSAFSPVGLFFLAMTAGRGETPDTRIRFAVKGVGQAHDDFKLPYEHEDNIAYQLARWVHLAEEIEGKGTIIFYNYADNSCLGEWFVQLYTESIQERGGGANVIPAKGPTSNHSILNGIIAGPKDKIVLFVHWEELGPDLVLPKDSGVDSELVENVKQRQILPVWAEFEGMSMTHMQTASYRGTALDFSEKGVSSATLALPKRDIESVCRLMRILMDTIAVKGRLQGLHCDNDGGEELTYLQDGVEGYKRNFRSFALTPSAESE